MELINDNILQVTSEEYEMIDKWLRFVGVRCRSTMMFTENGKMQWRIESNNPYKFWIDDRGREIADMQMSASEIAKYKM